MISWTTRIAAAGLAGVFLMGASKAQAGAGLPPKLEKWLEQYDTNGDGKLDATEMKKLLSDVAAACTKYLVEHGYDTNGDGKISGPELSAFLKDLATATADKLKTIVDAIVRVLDTFILPIYDDIGTVKGEWEQAEIDKFTADTKAYADTNKDGTVSADEVKAFLKIFGDPAAFWNYYLYLWNANA